MKKKDDFKWSIALQWSEEDRGYIALIHELPGHSAFGRTLEQAVKEARTAAELYIETLEEDGAPIPEPNLMHEYSGQVRLRMPKTLHRNLAELSALEGMSLNSYMVYLLATATGRSQAKPVDRDKRTGRRGLARTG